ncbi:MAG: cytochrome c oxidase subunit I [Aquisalimonadaceae bacterium]
MSGADRRLSPEELHRAFDRDWRSPPGLRSLTAVNHTVIGKRFMMTGFLYFLVGGILAMLIRAQLAIPDSRFMNHEIYHQVFTMHGTVMMFLFAIPVIEGVAFYLIPKLLGARDLAYPRLSAFGYFCYLFGGLLLLGSLLVGAAPDSGWFMYTPLSGARYSPGSGADVWLLGITFVEISAVSAGVELTASILKVRTAGMSLRRMPLFGWYMLVTAMMIVVGFPPLILASILLELERAFGWPFFDVAGGGDPVLWQHLFWLFGHPEVYIIFLPGAAIVSTLIPVFARHPIVGHDWIVASVIATGFISFALWAHHMYAVGIPHLAMVFFSAASLLVAIPTTIQFYAWIATLWAGRPALRLPMLYLFGFLVIFVLGGLTGVMVAVVPFDWQVHDTHFVVAHLHYVLIGGLVFPLLAGAYYWMPHVTGRMPSELLGRWGFWLIFIGFNVTFFVMHLTGLLGMPRRVYTYPEGLGWEWPNLISSIGGFIMSAGFALFIVDLLLHGRYGRRSQPNPWGAGTLEWAMAIPPPSYNVISQPWIGSRHPLQDQPNLEQEMARGEHLLGTPSPGHRETLGVSAISGDPEYVIRLPGPSWLPLLSGLAMAIFFLAFLAKLYWFSLAGLLLALAVMLRWAWINGLRVDSGPVDAGMELHIPLHVSAAEAPGWWGMIVLLVSNGAFFASLLFGYFYLWIVPMRTWPTPQQVDGGLHWSALTLLGVCVGAFSLRRAIIINRHGSTKRAEGWLITSALGGLAGLVGVITLALTEVPAAAGNAYAAITTVLLAYAGFHVLLGGILSAFALLRCRHGYVSPQRDLDLRVISLWWTYTLTVGLLSLAVMHGLPLAMGAS